MSRTDRVLDAYTKLVDAAASQLGFKLGGDRRILDSHLRRRFPGKHPHLTISAAERIADMQSSDEAQQIATDALQKILKE